MVHEVTTEIIEIWFNQLKIENDYVDNTINRTRLQFNPLFNFLVKKNVLASNPLDPIIIKRTPPYKRKRIHFQPDQIEHLISLSQKFSPGHLYPILLMFADTACKIFELINLEWNDINFKKNTIHFKRSQRLQERKVEMSERLSKALKAKKIFTEHVFTDYNYGKLNKNKLVRVTKEFNKHCNIDFKWSIRDLRHSFAYNYLEGGGDVKELCYMLGHHRTHETKLRYIKASYKIPAMNSLY